MALLTTETTQKNPQRTRCAAGRGTRLRARAGFVGAKESPWHS